MNRLLTFLMTILCWSHLYSAPSRYELENNVKNMVHYVASYLDLVVVIVAFGLLIVSAHMVVEGRGKSASIFFALFVLLASFSVLVYGIFDIVGIY